MRKTHGWITATPPTDRGNISANGVAAACSAAAAAADGGGGGGFTSHSRKDLFVSAAPPASTESVKALCASLIRSDVTVQKEGLSALIRASCLERSRAKPNRA
ncbi:hypothetical protein PBY51_023236 [Eleginops maclovinus]|uniref:Uncharacterized protein n=1 Tax=Eleginops maclovinus TaxID=56733 RepID=A0AAN7WSU1_ELEMC|nr:hypothetical protein PBY51_023236 [Eleginops maclovinus]